MPAGKAATDASPLWAVELALQAVLVSVQQFTSARAEWTSLSSGSLPGIPSLGVSFDSGGSRQPSQLDADRVRIPIEGEAWEDYRESIRQNAEALKGIRSFRTTVQRELEHVQRLRIESKSNVAHASNAPFLCFFWQQVLQTSLTNGPVTELNASIPIPVPGKASSSTTKRRKKPNRHKKSAEKLAKVDVIAKAGSSWTRILTIKRSSLLAEFRVAESEMLEPSDSSDSGSDNNGTGSDMVGSSITADRAVRLDQSCRHLFSQLDAATANCSIVRNAEELLACRRTAGESQKVDITFVISRVELPAPNDEALGLDMEFLTTASEEERYDKRLQCISNLLDRLPDVTFSSPIADDKILCPPSGKILPSSLASGQVLNLGSHSLEDFDSRTLWLPAMPDPSKAAAALRPYSVTRDLNLDVSALVALASDVTHMSLPSRNVNLDTMFRAGGLKSIAAQDRAAAKGTPPESVATAIASAENDMDNGEPKGKFLHGRALALQLGLEAFEGKSFILYLAEMSKQGHESQPLRLWASAEAHAKFEEIMRLVGGPIEQSRAAALFSGDSDTFWSESRFQKHGKARTSIEFPIRIHATDSNGMRSCPASTTAFTNQMHSALIDGLQDLDREAQGIKPVRTGANPRQTAHTLNSLLSGLHHNMTTLTTNMLSVRWLVREINRRCISSPSHSNPAARMEESEDHNAHAVIFVTNPRSLAERMRIDAANAAATAATPESHEDGRNQPDTGAIESSSLKSPRKLAQNGSLGQRAEEQTDVSNPLASSSRQPTSSTPQHLHHPEMENDTESCLPAVREPQRSFTLDTYPSFDRSSFKESPLRTPHDFAANLPQLNDGSRAIGFQASANPSRQDDCSSSGRHRRMSRLKRVLVWIGGPRPAVRLRVRHYRWWPLRRVEDAWLQLTRGAAWKQPLSFKRQDQEDSTPSSSNVTGIRRSKGPWRRPVWLRRGESHEVYGMEGLRTPATEFRNVEEVLDEPHPAALWHSRLQQEWSTNKVHWTMLSTVYIAWLLGFSFLVKAIWNDASVLSASSGNSVEPSFLSCTDSFWAQNERCGVNGESCRPFSQNTTFAFRCPKSCSKTTLGAARAVGSSLPNFVPLVVGGADATRSMYRGDSWICPAAVHAGIINDNEGGCGQLWLAGTYSNFVGRDMHGINSESFNSTFPISYFFQPDSQTDKCTDRRSQVYALNVILSSFVGFVLQPKAIVWFWTLFCLGFWHVNYASEPRAYPPTPGGPMGDFLPTLFVGYGIWRLTFRFVFPAFQHFPLERTIWTLAAFWIGTLLNVVFANVPLQRLVASDIASQPGALTALIVIIIVVILIAINQIRAIRKSGYLPQYLSLLIVGAVIIGLLAAVPETGLRLHHYIIALILLPFTAFETRLSLIYCCFLLGMFLNGVGRWGYDGIIQDESVIRGDSTAGTDIPTFLPASNWTGVNATTGIGFVHWQAAPANSTYDGFDLMIDDVLRVSASSTTSFDLGTLPTYYAASGTTSNTTFYPGGRDDIALRATIADQPHYLRLAYTTDGSPGDFTEAATVWFNGTFVEPEPGRT